jgi:type VI secretion system protein ImpH
MATSQRQADLDLIARILDQHQGRDDFFQLVRSLERQALSHSDERRVVPVGRDGPPAAEPIRFHVVNSVAFAGRAVERLWKDDEVATNRIEMDVAFMGLTGPTGVLPPHYGNLIQARLKQRDSALAEFLDLFNHRLIALFYRAWAKYRLTVQHEDHARDPQGDPFARALCALAGQHPQQRFDPRLYYAGHFSRRTRSASSLQQLLADFLGSPVQVESFIGQWLPIAPEHRLRVGSGGRGRNHRLGDGVLLGERAWDMQSKFRIQIGPISDAEHERLLPDGDNFQQLRRLIEEYVPNHMDVELRLVVDGTQPRTPESRMRLGQNAWLGSRRHRFRISRIQLRRGCSSPAPGDATKFEQINQ